MAKLRFALTTIGLVFGAAFAGRPANAQVNVLTVHNDIARTGQNLNETVLTPANVNPTQFGKLFSIAINGETFAQPLYVSQVAIPGKGTHNVVYVATSQNVVYAFDADNNGGVNAFPLWQTSLLSNSTSQFGVQGTPVIDLPSKTMYLVSSEIQNGTSTNIFRVHALDITTGVDKVTPTLVQASMPGTGSGSSGGTLAFDAYYHRQRPGLLLLNGVLYVAFASVNDIGPWHGWIFSYNASNLQPIDVFCDTVNGTGGGIWMGGSGLAAEVNDPSKPYGRMFFATGNGTYAVSQPYTKTMSYGMTLMNLDLTGGVMTVQDTFTPYNEAHLDYQDGDLGSGGPILLPTQNLASGSTLNPLIEVGKSGMLYILNRNNLGGFNATADNVVQEVQTPQSGAQDWGAGIWGSPGYWNNHLYFGGTNPGASNSITSYSFINGVLSTTPTSRTFEQFPYPAPTPSISSNGTQNGIVWVLDTHAYVGGGPEVMYAYDATNLDNLLYSTNANAARDAVGGATRLAIPTIANGKVYTPASYQFDVYGLLGSVPTAPAPVITPGSGSFTGSQTVAISDSLSGAQIYYTTDGSVPSVNSRVYSAPFKVTASQTITAIASVTGYLQSPAASATFQSSLNADNPVFSLTPGTYTGTQTVTITSASKNSVIYYTVDGTTPSTSSKLYTQPVTIPVSETIQAFATAPGLLPSAVVASNYTISPVYLFNFSNGFSQAQPAVQFNGSTDLDDFRLQLTNGGKSEAGSAFYATPVNIQAFTTNFTFQLSNPAADGFTFTIQNVGPTALGVDGGSLGYATIPNSVAIKFDLYNNAGEGINSTGLYVNGAQPTVPSIDLTGSAIDLHSGNYIDAQVTYDGKGLTLTLTNPISLQSWSHTWLINIPATIGSNSAWVGFTGGTGGLSASQKLTSWTFLGGAPVVPNFPVGFDGAQVYYNNAWLSGTTVQMSSGGPNETNSIYFSKPVDIEAFTSDFDYKVTKGITSSLGEGMTFVIQNNAVTALGGGGAGLGYVSIPNSVAIKFDLYNDVGEGNDSTGVYLNGATPTLPSTDLTSSLVELGNGDSFHVHITYDGTTLKWRISDNNSSNPLVSSNSLKINIPHTISSNTAYVGFTASTGAATAIQQIFDWTFTNP